MAALGRRLRELSGSVRMGMRGVKTPPGAPAPPQFEESTAEFALVERLLPPTRVPAPPPRPPAPAPSGWSPPAGPPPGLPYFVRRSRFHNLPVYLRGGDGRRRLTELRGAQGDLQALARDLCAFLGGPGGPEPRVQVNEVTGTLRLGGHWGAQLRQWLLLRGF
ncbi:large ribosomal subunit protein mL49 [Patagioenas fasciata]|uniref:large ribosomal subunit protein mL49 n=1 Tax=Patagioenas fasciata TaxID=372321 RepID=UPI003A99C948